MDQVPERPYGSAGDNADQKTINKADEAASPRHAVAAQVMREERQMGANLDSRRRATQQQPRRRKKEKESTDHPCGDGERNDIDSGKRTADDYVSAASAIRNGFV
jgi:hypothetical protein